MASVTYLNIAVKVVYWWLFEDIWRGPPLMSRKGFFYWTAVSSFSSSRVLLDGREEG